MVNVYGGRDWSAATRDSSFLEVFSTQVKFVMTTPIYG